MRQNFRQNNGLTKRERKPAIVLNDDGTKIDLEALAKVSNLDFNGKKKIIYNFIIINRLTIKKKRWIKQLIWIVNH